MGSIVARTGLVDGQACGLHVVSIYKVLGGTITTASSFNTYGVVIGLNKIVTGGVLEVTSAEDDFLGNGGRIETLGCPEVIVMCRESLAACFGGVEQLLGVACSVVIAITIVRRVEERTCPIEGRTCFQGQNGKAVGTSRLFGSRGELTEIAVIGNDFVLNIVAFFDYEIKDFVGRVAAQRIDNLGRKLTCHKGYATILAH